VKRANAQSSEVNVPPEHRLYAAMIGSVCIPVSLFWFAWTAKRDVFWMAPVAAGVPFGFGNLVVWISMAMYIVDTYAALTAASAIAAGSFVRYLLGAAFPLFTKQMFENLGIGWAASLLGFLSVGLAPVPWVLYYFGPAIRKRSRYPTTKF